MIKVEQVKIEYALGQAKRLAVLSDFSMQVSVGEIVAVIGPSGCGKTTLLNALAGLVPVTAGSICVAGSNPQVAREKRAVSYVFQRPVLFPWRTVLQNVLLPVQLRCRGKGNGSVDWLKKAGELLNLMGIHEKFWHELPVSLSGGMQARVALARACITSPEVLLMDEPFASLDQITRDKMNLELLKMRRTLGSTIVFVTHSIEEAVFISDRVVLLSNLPARVNQEIVVKLPQSREVSLRDSADFINVTRVLREALSDVYTTSNS